MGQGLSKLMGDSDSPWDEPLDKDLLEEWEVNQPLLCIKEDGGLVSVKEYNPEFIERMINSGLVVEVIVLGKHKALALTRKAYEQLARKKIQ